MKGRSRVLVRQWQLVRELSAGRYGLTMWQLIERVGSSKQSLYRDLATFYKAIVCNTRPR
jgi:hypothetical protein